MTMTKVYTTATNKLAGAVIITGCLESMPLLICTAFGTFRQNDPATPRATSTDGTLYMNVDSDGYPVEE